MLALNVNPIQALKVSVSPAKIVNGEYYILRGSTEKIKVCDEPNASIDIAITCKFKVNSQNGKYSYELEDFPIPIDVNSVIIKSYRVKNLKIKVPIFLFFKYSKEVNASNGVAKITINRNISAGKYTIEISGETNDSEVTIEATAKSEIKLNENGEYAINYDTSKLPIGDLIINAGGESIKAHVVSELPSTPTTVVTTTATPQSGSSETEVTTVPTTATTIPTTVVTTIPTTVTTVTAATTAKTPKTTIKTPPV